MSTETAPQPTEEPIVAPIEGQEGAPTPKPEEKTESFRPWKENPPEEDRVPYSRFREVNQERKDLAARAAAAEAKLREIEQREADLAKIKSPADIKIEDFQDPNEYLAAREKAVKAEALREFQELQNQRDRERVQRQQQQVFLETYQKNLNEAIQRNPEIREAEAFINRLATEHGLHVHPDIAYELGIDENLGELLFDIATDKALLNEMYTGNPADFVRKLHKMSAKIDREARYGKKPGAEGGEEGAGRQAPELEPLAKAKQEIDAAIPTQVRGGTPVVRKDPGKMSNAEYRQWVAKGRPRL